MGSRGPELPAPAGGWVRTGIPEEPVDPTERSRFEAAVLPHLDAAYTLARYLLRDEHDAQDVVQESFLRALRYFSGYAGGDARAWLLAIVRNACYALRKRRAAERTVALDAEGEEPVDERADAEAATVRGALRDTLARAIDALPAEFREVIVLREVQGLSYQEIGTVIGAPVGTVMSRLSRARERLRRALLPTLSEMR